MHHVLSRRLQPERLLAYALNSKTMGPLMQICGRSDAYVVGELASSACKTQVVETAAHSTSCTWKQRFALYAR
jgi:hypothetical protein